MDDNKSQTDSGFAMLLVYPLAWFTDKLAWLICPRWRDLSKGNPAQKENILTIK